MTRTPARRRDDAVGELISYIFMFALGAIALSFAINVLVDARETSDEIAAATQLKQAGQIVAGNLQEAVRVANAAPAATYNATYELPTAIQGRAYAIDIVPSGTNCQRQDVVVTADDHLASAVIPLGNASLTEVSPGVCLTLRGSFHSSAGVVTVLYRAKPSPNIDLRPTTRVT